MREMKDSGVEWIGKIPNGWSVCKLKNISNIINGSTPSRLEKRNFHDSIGVAWYKPDCLNYNQEIKKPKEFITNKNIKGCTVVDKDAIIVNCVGEVGKWGIARGVFSINQQLNAIVFNDFIDFNYGKWIVASLEEYSYNIATSNLLPYLNLSKHSNLKIPLAPEEYQIKIANYLDKKCSKIDEIITKLERQIQKLEIYVASLINELVTKGFHSRETMKVIDHVFLNSIPSEWKLVKFGRCASIKSNLVSPKDYVEYPQISPDCIEKNSGRLLTYKTVEDSGIISWNHLFYPGQILYSKIRPLLNKVVIADFEGLCSADMYPIETNNSIKFIQYVMLSNYFNAQVGLVTSNRVKMPKINREELSNIIIALPDLKEQHKIACSLETKCNEVYGVIENKKKVIKKLNEYKKSLIYEVVTGKKEV